MTKEELYKEAEEYIKNKQKPISKYDLVAFAKKHIAELESEVNRLKLNEQLAVNNGKNLLKENAELKAQIEKMKYCVVSCCEGCERLPKLYKEFDKEIKEK